MQNRDELKVKIQEKISEMTHHLNDCKESQNLINAIEAALELTNIMDEKKAKVYLNDLNFALKIPAKQNIINLPSDLNLFAHRQYLSTEWQIRLDALLLILTIAVEFLINLTYVMLTAIPPDFFLKLDDYLGVNLVDNIKKRFKFDISDSLYLHGIFSMGYA